MYLNYAKLSFDKDGIPEHPELLLQTMHKETIGVIPGVSNLKLEVKFSEPSEIDFDVARMCDGQENWIFPRLTGFKRLYTKDYGVYVLMNPEDEADGIQDTMHVHGYSIEYELSTKKFFIEEGTFKFFDQTNPTNEDTLIGRILEVATGWSVGYIAPTLAQRYRTFDEYDAYLLNFMYGDAKDKYHAVFVFDPYEMTINAYDADETIETLPIYLDFDNLLKEIQIEELSDELVTALRPYGDDNLDIRAVNPIGSNWIYDLTFFIENGDIPKDLADKWKVWQQTIRNNQSYYAGLVAMQASSSAQLIACQAAMADLQGEMETLKAQQSITVQALAMETTAAGKQYQQELLSSLYDQIEAKQKEIDAKQKEIDALNANLDPENESSYAHRIKEISDSLAITKFFTPDEYEILSHYLIEKDITENTFVGSAVSSSTMGESYSLSGAGFSVTGSAISRIDLTQEFNRVMYTLTGGQFQMTGDKALSGDVIRGTIEVTNGTTAVVSIYAGTLRVNDVTAASGMITLSGTVGSVTSDVHPVTVQEVTTDEGTQITLNSLNGVLFVTADVSEYQKYAVQMELYDFAAATLADLATPTYEFNVSSGNFIFANQFAPFRDKLELGKGVYLNTGHGLTITPYIIEFTLDFEDRSKFSIVFSNRFKRYDSVGTLSDMLEKSYSTSRGIDASKHKYNQTANQASMVSRFMQSSLDAAVNSIIAAANQSVVIDGAGINVSNQDAEDEYLSNFELRIVNGMIAFTKDHWRTADLAIGVFKTENGYYSGVNAQVIAGKLVAGENLIIESQQVDASGQPTGVTQFRVDASGAWLNNAPFILQSDKGGKMFIHPDYGMASGGADLFTLDGTNLHPSFIDGNGGLIVDRDTGIPEGVSFYIDPSTGNAYFSGTVVAHAGEIGGFTIAEDYLRSGAGSSFVGLNGSGTNAQSAYAFWAGGENPANAQFWVKKNGEFFGKQGTFQGTVQADHYLDAAGNEMMTDGKFSSKYLDVRGLNVNNQFVVDDKGNVTLGGDIRMTGGDFIGSKIYNQSRTSYFMVADMYDPWSYKSGDFQFWAPRPGGEVMDSLSCFSISTGHDLPSSGKFRRTVLTSYDKKVLDIYHATNMIVNGYGNWSISNLDSSGLTSLGFQWKTINSTGAWIFTVSAFYVDVVSGNTTFTSPVYPAVAGTYYVSTGARDSSRIYAYTITVSSSGTVTVSGLYSVDPGKSTTTAYNISSFTVHGTLNLPIAYG